MSTNYKPLCNIRARDMFDGRLEKCGVREHIKHSETTPARRCLTDGRSFLWVDIGNNGVVNSLTRCAPNGVPGKILAAVAETFGTEIVSEHEPRYWGFETQEEWDRFVEQAYNRFEAQALRVARKETPSLY